MKKIYVLLLVAGISFSLSNCTYDDSALWNEMEQIKDRVSDLEESVLQTNEEIEALQAIINALQNNLYITSVEQTADGYTIVFSDGTSANIMNGKDGVNGTNAPLFSVKQDTDGNYYYIGSSKKAKRDCYYGISKTNGLLPSGGYWFDADGKIILD